MGPDRNEMVDRLLDQAVRQYGRVTPRGGLEERVLTHLRRESRHADASIWWWRYAAAGLVLVLLVGVGRFASHRRNSRSAEMVSTVPAKVPSGSDHAIQAADQPMQSTVRTGHHAHRQDSAVAGKEPHLDQFPSPQPLSPEEQLLASYVREWPQEAMQLAKARAELLQQALLELEKENHVPEHSQEFEQ